MKRPLRSALCCAGVPLLFAACGDGELPAAERPVAFASGIGQVMDDTLDGIAAESAGPDLRAPEHIFDSVSGVVAVDTAPVATPGELRELAVSMVIPVAGVRTADLIDSYTDPRGSRAHHALDIHAPRGTSVLSATSGKILRLHESKAGGLMVYAADASGRFILMYGHLERYAEGLSDGSPLHAGQVIGYVGTSGNAAPDTPHLHFVVSRGRPAVSWWRGTPVNPYDLFVRYSTGRP